MPWHVNPRFLLIGVSVVIGTIITIILMLT